MGLRDIFNKDKYRFRTQYNGVIISKTVAAIRGQLSVYNTKNKHAYLIPESLQPLKDGSAHEINYDMRDACPLADVKDIAPDMVRDLEMQICPGMVRCINLTINDPESLLEPSEVKALKDAKDWLNRYQFTGVFFNLWRWGYVKTETWWKALRYVPAPEYFVLPKKLSRVGLRPGYLYEREHATIVQDAIRRKEPEWAWLKDIIIPLIIVLAIVAVIALFLGRH